MKNLSSSPAPVPVHLIPFDRLDTDTLYRILKLRAEVFVVEQNCVYLDPEILSQKSV